MKMSRRLTSAVDSWDVEEKMVTVEYRMSRMRIIHITLSPWILSIQFHIPLFSVLLSISGSYINTALLPLQPVYRLRTASLNFLPLSS